MMPRVARRPRPVTRAGALDLSRKTSLVPRAGVFSRGQGLVLKTRARRLVAFAWRVAGFALAAAAAARLALGALSDPLALGPWDLVLVAALAAVLVHRVARRLGRPELAEGDAPGRRRRLEQDLELALVSVTALYVVLGLTGGLASPLYPALYLVVALVMIFHRPAVGIAAVALTLAVEGLLAWRHGDLAVRWSQVAFHGGFVVAFAGLYHGVLAAGLAESRRKARVAVDAHVREIHERARAYRLVVSASEDTRPAGAEQGQEKWLVAAVQEVEAAVRAALEVAEAALGTHTVAVLLLSADEKVLRLHECLSASEQVVRQPLAAGEGLPGVVLRRRGPVRLCGSFRGTVYDEGSEVPQAFLGVPLLEARGAGGEGFVRGVLVADRLEARAFTEADERVLAVVAREVLRAIEVERVMGYIRKEKDEKSRFYRAIEALNVLSKPQEICEAITRLAAELAPVDFVAVTLAETGPTASETEAPRLVHRVVEATGPGAEGLAGVTFDDNAGLVANVVRLGSPLPGRDFHAMEKTVVFSEKEKLRGLSTLKVLPMSVGEEVVGTVVCGAKGKGALSEDAVRMLGVLAIQAAGAIERGRLFEKTERMATTDGLTGLNNHRRFQELLDGHLAAARRYGRQVSLIICDVDHFKSVNDTYGHPVGDKVLKGVSRMLQSQARDTDVVARYGGEEFAVILPETDTEGAMVIAGRIREKVAAETFQSELGPLKVTISLGVATCPRHADQKQALVDLADHALYAAKHGGRNRVVCQEG